MRGRCRRAFEGDSGAGSCLRKAESLGASLVVGSERIWPCELRMVMLAVRLLCRGRCRRINSSCSHKLGFTAGAPRLPLRMTPNASFLPLVEEKAFDCM